MLVLDLWWCGCDDDGGWWCWMYGGGGAGCMVVMVVVVWQGLCEGEGMEVTIIINSRTKMKFFNKR